MNIHLSANQLRHAADLKERIEALEAELSALLGGTPEQTPHHRHISFEARARIAAAQRLRWAKTRAGANQAVTNGPRRKMSAAARSKIAAAARARWRKVKAAGLNTL